jgi:A/G-specific adenine glycosylase
VEAFCAPGSAAALRRSGRLDGLNALVDPILRWGGEGIRNLPWRDTRDRWRVLVSEVMLQQTQADRVVPKYLEFIDRFPTAQACSDAPLGDLLTLWQGLGFPRRCRNLHAAAREIVDRHDGAVPGDLAALLALPGIGDYTARAVLAFADGAAIGVVDTNVSRVFSRQLNRPLARREATDIADSTVPGDRSWEWNQLLMDLGARVCTARSPRCDACPVAATCGWHRSGGDDPAPRSFHTSKPQGRFDGSDRQARGRLMKAVVTRSVDREAAPSLMGLTNDVQRASRLIDDLLREGLLVEGDGWLVLP